MRRIAKQDSRQFDISNLSSALYMIEIKVGTKKYNLKLVKN